MKPSPKPQKSSSLFKISLTCTFAGSALLILVENVIVRIESIFTGVHVYSDPTALIFVLVFSCLILFIPVFLGVILLRVFLRYQLRKGWLTPKTSILSGMGIWAMGGMVFCLFFIVFDPFPPDPSLQPHNFWGMIPLLLHDVFLSGIAIACLAGGWAGHVLYKQILFAQQLSLAEQ